MSAYVAAESPKAMSVESSSDARTWAPVASITTTHPWGTTDGRAADGSQAWGIEAPVAARYWKLTIHTSHNGDGPTIHYVRWWRGEAAATWLAGGFDEGIDGAALSYEELRSLGSTPVVLVHESSGGEVFKSDERLGAPPENVMKVHRSGTRGTPLTIVWHEASILTMLIEGKPIRTTGDYRHGARVVEVGLVGRGSDPNGKWELHQAQDGAGTHFCLRNVTNASDFMFTHVKDGGLLTNSSQRDVFTFRRHDCAVGADAKEVAELKSLGIGAHNMTIDGTKLDISDGTPKERTLAEMAGILKEQLGLPGAAMHEVVDAACEQVGVATEGKTIMQKAREACEAIGV